MVRGTNYKVGFGVSLFFLIGGIAFLVFAGEDLPFIDDDGTGAASVAGDAAAPTFRMIGWIWTGVASFLLALFLLLKLRSLLKRRLIDTGIDGVAVVESAETTNTYINGMPQYRLELAVMRADGGTVHRCTRREIVPNTALGRWGIGTQLPVRIDPDDAERFEILWDALPPPGMPTSSANGDLAELAALHRLYEQGVLTESEFNTKKWEILARKR